MLSDKIIQLIVRAYRKKINLFNCFCIPVYIGIGFILGTFLLLIILVYATDKYYPGPRTSNLFFSSFTLCLIIQAALFSAILIHELGHAYFIRKNNFQVDYIYISAIYGICIYTYYEDEEPPPIIAYGGILAQIPFAIAIWIVLRVVDYENAPYDSYLQNFSVIWTFLSASLFIHSLMIIVNLFPYPGLDGEKIFKHLGEVMRGRRS